MKKEQRSMVKFENGKIYLSNPDKRVIRIDTRECKNKPILDYFFKVRQPFIIAKVDAGDYCYDYNEENGEYPSVVVDTKKDMMEVITNLTKGHERFRKEILRANEHNCKLVVLIREPLARLESVKYYKPRRYSKNFPVASLRGKPMSNANMETIYKVMYSMKQKYNLDWQFCDKEDAGRKILQILNGGNTND